MALLTTENVKHITKIYNYVESKAHIRSVITLEVMKDYYIGELEYMDGEISNLSFKFDFYGKILIKH